MATVSRGVAAPSRAAAEEEGVDLGTGDVEEVASA